MENTDTESKWTDEMNWDDLAFIKRFILASGSLKELARIYGISYPTVRLRLDRLIEKIKLLDSHNVTSEFERTLRILCAEGKMDTDTMNRILAAHRKEKEASK